MQLRYLAILSHNPSALAAFYNRVFALRELARSDDGDVALTDGYVNISLYRLRPQLGEPRLELGLHHIGFQVDDLDRVIARYHAINPRGLVVEEPDNLSRGEARIFDHECLPVTLSKGDFGVGGDVDRLPRMRHVAFNALDPERFGDFYQQVFGLRELGAMRAFRRRGRPNAFLGDGRANLAVHPFYTDNFGHEARYGVNHFGFLVNDLERMVAAIAEEPGASVAPRPERPYEDYRARDPEGNGVDLCMTKGLEVDSNKLDTVDGVVEA
ncbi:MAG: VOC family protein [Alphaproteobacteria bacterium]|nr:VOC family protein [Alphaproteobacteria bacterium]